MRKTGCTLTRIASGCVGIGRFSFRLLSDSRDLEFGFPLVRRIVSHGHPFIFGKTVVIRILDPEFVFGRMEGIDHVTQGSQQECDYEDNISCMIRILHVAQACRGARQTVRHYESHVLSTG